MVIPNLPDDISLQCLIRLPKSVQLRLRSVSKRWNEVLGSEEFRTFRRSQNLVEELFLIVSRSSLLAYDFKSSTSHRIGIPEEVDRQLSYLGFRCVSSGSKLFIIGGSSTSAEGLVSENHRELNIFDAATNSWSRGGSMRLGRSYFACGCMEGVLYVVGGEFSGRTAEAYDICSGEWSEVPPMPVGLDRIESFIVFKRRLYIKGLVSGERRVFVLDPAGRGERFWDCSRGVENGISDGEFIATEDHLYVMCRQTGYVGRFDEALEKWTQVGCLMPFLSSSHPEDVFYISNTSGDNLGLVDLKRSRKALLRAVWQCPGAIVRV